MSLVEFALRISLISCFCNRRRRYRRQFILRLASEANRIKVVEFLEIKQKIAQHNEAHLRERFKFFVQLEWAKTYV